MESDNIGPAPFGEVLKTYRKRSKVTQRQLAEKLGVHYNTVWAWERGDHLPETRGIVLELAKHLRLNDRDTRHLLEASLTALSVYWHIPYPRNPFFTGRAEILQHLHEVLNHEYATVRPQSYALSGLGGMGKTQTALEYAYRYYQYHTAVFWISADTHDTIASSFTSIADLLSLPEKHEQDQSRILAAVTRWLTSHCGWLLIFDNVEDAGMVRSFLPAARCGSLLLTTRLQALGAMAQSIELPQMSLEESQQFLLCRAKLVIPGGSYDQVSPTDAATAVALAEAMDGLPLALDQAASYIDTNKCNLPAFLHLFQTHPISLLHVRDVHEEHPLSVAKTFTLAFATIQAKNALAAEVLTLCAFLAPDAIPEALLTMSASLFGTTFASLATNPLHFNAALKDLLAHSLIRRNPATQTLTIHRLVQDVLKGGMDETGQRLWAERAIRAVNHVFPDVEFANWQQCQHYLPHALVCTRLIKQWNVVLPEAARLLYHTGAYLQERADYSSVEPLYVQALEMRRHLLGEEHPEVAQILDKLASLYEAQWKDEQAELHYQSALDIRARVLGPEHPDLAESFTHLAFFYYKKGKYAQAVPLQQQALVIFEQALGSHHLKVATSLNHLAVLYHEQGKYTQAEPLYQRALAIREQALGPEHPDVASSLKTLGALYHERGWYIQAEMLYQRALTIREQAFGPEHPIVALSLRNLAMLYKDWQQYALVEPLYQRALTIREKTFGLHHPFVADIFNALAELYFVQKQHDQAEVFFTRALTIWEEIFGPDHPDVAQSLMGLAELFSEQGKYDQAEHLGQRALLICEQTFGPTHPDVAQCLTILADISRVQEKYSRAEELYTRAIDILYQDGVPTHQRIITSLHGLAKLSCTQGNHQRAEGLLQQALTICENMLPSEHPQRAETLHEFTTLSVIQGKDEHAFRGHGKLVNALEEPSQPS